LHDHQKNSLGHIGHQSNPLRPRCDALGFERLPIEIIAERKVAPAFEPQTGSGYAGILTMRD
jgi:hypothetical protein